MSEVKGQTKGGLLIGGIVMPLPGITVYNPTDTSWAKLDGGDYRQRHTTWIRQVIIHTTKGIWPQKVLSGAGAGDRDKLVANFWKGDPTHSAAQLVVDTDGSIACLCDLAKTAAYHAELSNDWSVGIEMYQMPDGGVYEATYDSTIALVLALCEHFGIPLQIPSRVYNRTPMARMAKDGGPDMVGVFGHRDNTSKRGQGDPGEEIFRRLAVTGAERLDFDNLTDLVIWKMRQKHLISLGEPIARDGLPGPGTVAAMRRRGFADGRAIDAASRE